MKGLTGQEINLRMKIRRCEEYLDCIEARLRAAEGDGRGNGDDMEGLLQALQDWSGELRLLYREFKDPQTLLFVLGESCDRTNDIGFWILTSAGAYLAGHDMQDGNGSSVAVFFEEAACVGKEASHG